MTRKSCLLSLACVIVNFWGPTVPASELPQEFASTMLATVEGKKLKAGDLLKPGRPTLLAFLGADCPLSQMAITGIPEALRNVSALESVSVAGILVARDDAADIHRLVRDFKPSFPLHIDEANKVHSVLGVKVVPTVVLIDGKGEICYQGRIDDRVEALGKRSKVRRNDLAEAVADLMAGRAVRVPFTEAVGCPVEMQKPEPTGSGQVEFYRDIQPILLSNCVVCHQPGGTGPFSLVGYEDATLWVPTGADLVAKRLMPPGQAQSDFEVKGKISGLNKEEQDLLKRWIDGGMKEGAKPANPPKLPPQDPDGEALGPPDFILKPSGPSHLAASGDDLYRFIMFPFNRPEATRIHAIRLLPGNRKVVHHALIFYGPAAELREHEAQVNPREGLLAGDKMPGFKLSMKMCDALGGKDAEGNSKSSPAAAYVPGGATTAAPPGLALVIPKQSDIVVQMHYHRSGKPEIDESSVAIYLAKDNTRQDRLYAATNINARKFIVIPPGIRRKVVEEWPINDDCQITAIGPHGHMLTISQTLTLIDPDGRERTLIHVPNYDFNWQTGYYFKQPIAVKKGSKIRVISLLDNTDANIKNPNKPPRAVFAGEDDNDEMVFPFIYLVVDRATKWNILESMRSIYTSFMIRERLQHAFGIEGRSSGSGARE